MPAIPKDRLPESTLALLREGYHFIPNRVKKYDSDIFSTRLMLKNAICIHGEDAAELFYQPGHFTREKAMPPTTLRLLQDKGSVQSLEGKAHRHRKAMFMRMMTPERLDQMRGIADQAWREAISDWADSDQIVLLDEAERLLTKAVCEWAGIPIGERNQDRRTAELSTMVAGAGSVGPTMWRAMMLRQRSELWARGVIRSIRSGRLEVPDDSPVASIAHHRDTDGRLLSVTDAGVELLNVLRPAVAIATFIVHQAHALHIYPESQRFAASSYDQDREWFVQEVRRHYPFFPFIGGVALKNLTWRDIEIPEGQWVMLDLYGNNHDARVWKDPDKFDPERIGEWNQSPFTLIPQGAGDFDTTHRCPGERLTIELMKQAAQMLTSAMTYEVPKQDLSMSMNEFPSKPASGFVMTNVRPQ